MISRNRVVIRQSPLEELKVPTFSKPSFSRAARLMAPAFLILTVATAAHAQGTMDFSGATPLMATFKTFAIYAGRSSVSAV